jgi:hypothetical protein
MAWQLAGHRPKQPLADFAFYQPFSILGKGCHVLYLSVRSLAYPRAGLHIQVSKVLKIDFRAGSILRTLSGLRD